MAMFKAVIVLLVVAAAPAAMASMASHLRKALFEGYDSVARPDGQVTLKAGFTLLKLNLCSHKDILTLDGYLKLSWHDDRLKWDAAQWNGMSQLTVPWTDVWTPDISVYEGVSEPMTYAAPSKMNRALIYPNGRVIWIPQVTIKSVCKAKGTEEVQQCGVRFGPWTEAMKELKMIPWTSIQDGMEDKAIDLDTYVPTQAEILNTTLTAVEKKYDCCDDLYNHLKMELTFKHMDGAHI